jgi:3-isopropylmalate dehydrogenase
MKQFRITVLKGDGIGPEIVDETIKVLEVTGKKYGFTMDYDYQLMGGCAIDATGVPLPEQTVESCKKGRQCVARCRRRRKVGYTARPSSPGGGVARDSRGAGIVRQFAPGTDFCRAERRVAD